MEKLTIEEFELKMKRHECHLIEDCIDKFSTKIKMLDAVKGKARRQEKIDKLKETLKRYQTLLENTQKELAGLQGNIKL